MIYFDTMQQVDGLVKGKIFIPEASDQDSVIAIEISMPRACADFGDTPHPDSLTIEKVAAAVAAGLLAQWNGDPGLTASVVGLLTEMYPALCLAASERVRKRLVEARVREVFGDSFETFLNTALSSADSAE